jgi:hypothetical protein
MLIMIMIIIIIVIITNHYYYHLLLLRFTSRRLMIVNAWSPTRVACLGKHFQSGVGVPAGHGNSELSWISLPHRDLTSWKTNCHHYY